MGRSIPLDEAGLRATAERLFAGWAMSRYLRGGGLAEAGRTLERQMAGWASEVVNGRNSRPAGLQDPADVLAAMGLGAPRVPAGLRQGAGDTEFEFGSGIDAGGRRAWRVWGQGDISTFAGDPARDRGYEGSLRTAWTGFDRGLGESWLAGVAVARSKGAGDWRAGAADGGLKTSMTAVHPYLRWSEGATSVWTIVGGGRGSAENTRGTGQTGTSSLGLRLGLFEVRRQLGDRVGIRADAAWARLATGEGRETIDGRSAAVDQQRLGMELSRSMRVGGLALKAFGEVSARRDGGAGQRGAGLEMSGGLGARRGRVRVDAQSRILVLHSARGYKERGLGVRVTVGSPSDEEGVSLSVSPRWGGAATASGALWEERLYGRQPEHAVAVPWSLDTQARWALRLPDGRLLAWSGSLDRSARGWGLAISGGIELTGLAGGNGKREEATLAGTLSPGVRGR